MYIMSSVVKAFFFDLDGTLVDTHEANYLAYRQAIADVAGVEATEELRQLIQQGRSSKEFIPIILGVQKNEVIDRINERKRETYKTFISHSTPNKYLVDFIKKISQHHITGLVTTAKKHNADTVLHTHDLNEDFSFKIFGDEVEYMKPHPEAYLMAIEKSGVLPHEILVFEDSDKGIMAATAAGLTVVHIKDFI